jgi:hypothetical protein
MRQAVILTGGVAVLAIVLVLLLPAFAGYHVGYNSATDHECLTRLVQWCK